MGPLQLREAGLSARPPRARHAGHLLRGSEVAAASSAGLAPDQGRPAATAAADAHQPRAGAGDAGPEAACPDHRSGQGLPVRFRPDAYADVPPGRVPARRGRHLDGAHARNAGGLRQGVLRAGHPDAAAAELLPVHRAVRRGGHLAPALRRKGLQALQGDRLVGSARRRDGQPRRARGRGLRSGEDHRVRVRGGNRSPGHAPPQPGRPAHALRERRALPGAAMKVSVNWLRELCPVSLSDDEIAQKLTSIGLEVEGREKRGIGPGVVAARVVARDPIPGSDHLSVCQVDDGAGTHQVVCGARNYGPGDVVPMARPGARLPNGTEVRRAKLRGVESDGMLLSQRELGLSDDHSGLMILPREARVGTPVDELLGLPDTILEVNVTPNRPDALSHVGIARELSAITGVPVRVPAAQPAGKGELPARLDVEDTQRCPRYVARVIEGVHVGPSPLWVQERLRACGVRPISNVVDATNLALLELGHPLHGFDLDKLAGRRIVVRRAREGEPLTTLDGKERELSADDLVIADGEKPVALAGVMGGQTSEVGEKTMRVLLESAMFEPAGIRRTARRHALHTEASHRFERGMDEVTAQLAADRGAQFIVQLAGGKLLPGAIDRYPSPRPPTRVWVRPARVSAVLGVEVPPAEVEQRLASLGLAPVDGSAERRLWSVPSWRRDLTREIDCAEEVARLRGYDTIPIE